MGILDMLQSNNNEPFPALSLPTPCNMDIIANNTISPQYQEQMHKHSYFQEQQGLKIEESHVPSPSAWASMLMTQSPPTTSFMTHSPSTSSPTTPQHEQQQYFNQLGLQNQMVFNQAQQQQQQQQQQQSINNQQRDYIHQQQQMFLIQRQQLQHLQQQQFSVSGNFALNAQVCMYIYL
jgi:hypothetical protein